MPLSESNKMAQSVDESRRSHVADVVAAAWGQPAGTALWWRSSGSHVFRVPAQDDRPASFLRFVPDSQRSYGAVAGVAALMHELHARGGAVVQPVPSSFGAFAETIDTELGAMHAMLLTAAPGDQTDVDVLTVPRAHAWGMALADLHRRAGGVDTELPDGVDRLSGAANLLSGDPAVADAVHHLIEQISGMPRNPAQYGVIHGDFELDNMAWVGDTATAYDFDEAARSWFAADVASAVRDLTAGTGRPTKVHAHLFDAFIAGYRHVGRLDDTEVRRLPLFAALNAASSLITLRQVIDAGDRSGDPDWQVRLRDKLDDHIQRQRRLVIGGAREDLTGH